MLKWLKQYFCVHKWKCERIDRSALFEEGTVIYYYKCNKCGKLRVGKI